jgi:hypothetical protein
MKYIILVVISLFIGCGGGGSRGVENGTNRVQYLHDSTLDKQTKIPSRDKVQTINPEILSLPTCNQSDARVKIIQTRADWISGLNDSSKSVFCVKPGDYRSQGTLDITNRSGTKDKPFYIVLDNGNDTHPSNLSTSELASVDLQFNNSNYWVIDRMASIGSTGLDDNPILFINSNNNVVNRFFADGSSGGITLRDNSHGNTIQNSRLQNMSELGRKRDRSCIVLEPRDKNTAILNTHIIHNELKNCNDGVHLLWRESNDGVDYAGTVIADNDISVDSSLYTDCHGNLNPNGECSYSENAIDIKSGSNDVNNPIIVANNHLWGFRKSDKTDSNQADPGASLVMHYGIKHVLVTNNTIFDCVDGIISVEKKRLSFALLGADIYNNAIIDTKYPLILTDAFNIKVEKNYLVNPLKSWLVLDGSDTITYTENEIVNKKSDDGVWKDKATNITNDSGNLYYTKNSGLRDLSFTTDKFTSPLVVSPIK